MALIDRTVTSLLDAFSSADPTPGGGSASALSGAIAASLLSMVASMPKSKTNAVAEREALDEANTEIVKLRTALVALIDRDADAYDLVVAAFRKPKGTDDEKAARKAAIQEATVVATEVPLETMTACAGLLKLAEAVGAHGNSNAASDVAVAIELARAGLKGARYNVDINLGGISDPAMSADLRARADRLHAGWARDRFRTPCHGRSRSRVSCCERCQSLSGDSQMKRVLFSISIVAVLLAATTPAFAQQTRKAAVTMTSSSAIGLLLHVSDNVALRPEFSFTRNSAESTTSQLTPTTTTNSTWILGAGASALFYVGRWDSLRTYLSPKFFVSHAKSSSSLSTTELDPTNAYSLGGAFGTQYGLGDRFAIFGELGLSYSWQKSKSNLSTSKANSIGTRSTIGGAFYF
jgi:formiminotetrahydrofolate cyclodeaminase